jgi:NADPH:quinone reductase-like Zn-dependent oxidoreductase
MTKNFESEREAVLEQAPRGSMHAVMVHRYGDSSVLEYGEARIPSIRPDEVLIKVHSAGVNPVDWKIREGKRKDAARMLPFIPGWDVSGTIEETGNLVSQFKKGDAVFARPDPLLNGAYAEYIAVPAFELAAVPSRIPMETAAGVPLAAQTAWVGLFEQGFLERDRSILIHGGSGGVGSFAIQLAKYAGAYVITTTSSRNVDLLRSLGADVVIDYTAEDFTKRIDKVDMVFDTVGGDTQTRLYGVLHRGGKLVSTVGIVDEAMADKHFVTAKAFMMVSSGSRLAEIGSLMERDVLRVIIEREFPLKEARAAHDLSQSGRATGKIILRVQ